MSAESGAYFCCSGRVLFCFSSDTEELLKQRVVGCKTLWAEVCVGGSSALSQPVWHSEFVLSFTVAASFCQHAVCPTCLMQPLSCSPRAKQARRAPRFFYFTACKMLIWPQSAQTGRIKGFKTNSFHYKFICWSFSALIDELFDPENGEKCSSEDKRKSNIHIWGAGVRIWTSNNLYLDTFGDIQIIWTRCTCCINLS